MNALTAEMMLLAACRSHELKQTFRFINNGQNRILDRFLSDFFIRNNPIEPSFCRVARV